MPSKLVLSDAMAAARQVVSLRRQGFDGRLILITEEDMDSMRAANRNLMANYRLAYDCIEDLAAGKSRCHYCMDYETCEKKGELMGCPEWVLMFPEVEKNDQSGGTTE